MTVNRTRFLVVSLVLCGLLSAASWLAAQARRDTPAPDSLYKYLSVFTEVLGLVQQAYVEQTDVQALLAGAYEGTADALGAFSVYVPADQVPDFRRLRREPPPDTGLLMVRDRGFIYVVGVAQGSPADRAGIETGDLLAKVDGQPTGDLEVWQIEAHLARERGKQVPLSVLRRGETHEVRLAVEAAELPLVATQRVRGVPVLRVARFAEGTRAAVDQELRKLAAEGVGELVIDLRGVAGGDAEAAFAVAELLVSGDLGSLESRDEVRQRFASASEPVWRGETVVLVDRGTLGAAEVLAKILDTGADATLVGEPTFGHAGRLAQIELSSGALLELTDAFYTARDGEPIDESLEPDLEVSERSRKLSEKDLTLEELILQHGVGVLEAEREASKQAA